MNDFAFEARNDYPPEREYHDLLHTLSSAVDARTNSGKEIKRYELIVIRAMQMLAQEWIDEYK